MDLLQAELLSLRSSAGVRLKKSVGEDSPFPVTCSAEVVAPPDAERYDVEAFNVRAVLYKAVLGGPPELGQAVRVEVESGSLPTALCVAIASDLHSDWLALHPGTTPGKDSLRLAELWEAARRPGQFVRLVTLLPELLEPYEGVDADGRSIRRFAIVDTQAPATEAAAAPRSSAVAAAPAPKPPLQVDPAALPEKLERELGSLRRRFGNSLTTTASSSSASAAAEGAASSVEQQLAGLRVSAAGGATSSGGAATEPLIRFQLSCRPTDPAWEAGRPLPLTGWAGAGYPGSGTFGVAVSPGSGLPSLQVEVWNRMLAEEAVAAGGRPQPLLSLLRRCENHAGQQLQEVEDIAAEVARRRSQAAAAAEAAAAEAAAAAAAAATEGSGPSRRPRRAESAFLPGSSSGSEGSYSGSEEYSDSSARGSDDEEDSGSGRSQGGGEPAAVAASGDGVGGGPGRGGLALTLDSLVLVDCDALEVLRINLEVACSRCRGLGDLALASSAVAVASWSPAGGGLRCAAECGQCHQAWEATAQPRTVHERSNVLAVLAAEGCTPLDLLPATMLAGQCSRCASSAAYRSVRVGAWNERACSRCHSKMSFKFSTALFVARDGPRQPRSGPSTAAPAAAKAGSVAALAGGGDAFQCPITPGQPLPGRGTCRHYGHSYRWLRFPCCGRRYPCDLCHEEHTDGHAMKWAGRMVCGFCSVEQPLAERCRECDKKLATSAKAPSGRRTRFWEGGQGCRDGKSMDRKDPHKWRGSKAKTVSRKDARVGARGAARRDWRAERAGEDG